MLPAKLRCSVAVREVSAAWAPWSSSSGPTGSAATSNRPAHGCSRFPCGWGSKRRRRTRTRFESRAIGGTTRLLVRSVVVRNVATTGAAIWRLSCAVSRTTRTRFPGAANGTATTVRWPDHAWARHAGPIAGRPDLPVSSPAPARPSATAYTPAPPVTDCSPLAWGIRQTPRGRDSRTVLS